MEYGTFVDYILSVGIAVVTAFPDLSYWEESTMPKEWTAYYWALAKEFGIECVHISRADMLASILTLAYIFLINRNNLDMRVGIEAAIATFVTLGIIHSVRVPWLLVRRTTGKENALAWGWGLFGIGFFSAFTCCLVYAGAWFYTMQPAVVLVRRPDARDVRISEVESEIVALRSFREPDDSLRRRTIKLGSELADFWANNPPPYYPGSIPNTSDPEKLRIYNEWQVRVERIYKEKYQQQILGIIRT